MGPVREGGKAAKTHPLPNLTRNRRPVDAPIKDLKNRIELSRGGQLLRPSSAHRRVPRHRLLSVSLDPHRRRNRRRAPRPGSRRLPLNRLEPPPTS